MPAALPPIVSTFTSPTDDLAAEYPDRPETVAAPDDSITIGSDSIDETTIIAKAPLQVLLGNGVTDNLSSITPGTIDTNFAASFTLQPYSSATSGGDYPAWYQEIVSDIVDYGFAGASLVSQTVNSAYIDGDNAENNFLILGATLYGHVNHPSGLTDPRINDSPDVFRAGIDGDFVYSRYRYASPWSYDPREVYAMFQKYGFESWIPHSDSITRSVTTYHLDREIDSIASLLATGFEERQNIRKVAQRSDYRRNYEYISESEQKESTSIVQQVVKTSIPISVPIEPEMDATITDLTAASPVDAEDVEISSDITVSPSSGTTPGGSY